MNVRETRALLASMYPGEGWQKRVAKMKDDQVIAIYLRLMQDYPDLHKTTEPDEQLRLF
jgi:hypothetical protein